MLKTRKARIAVVLIDNVPVVAVPVPDATKLVALVAHGMAFSPLTLTGDTGMPELVLHPLPIAAKKRETSLIRYARPKPWVFQVVFTLGTTCPSPAWVV